MKRNKRVRMPTLTEAKSVLLVLTAFAIIIILWQVILSILRVPRWLIPTPYDVYIAYVERAHTKIIPNAMATLIEAILGFGLGVASGVLLGIVVFYSSFLRKLVYPLAVFIKVIPIIAIAPLLTIWFGFGMTSKVAISALIVFFPMLVNTMLGLMSVDKSLIDLLESVSASEFQIFTKVRLIWALPHIFSGMKISITSAVIGAVIGEFVGAKKGLGTMILLAQSYADAPVMFVMLLVLAAIGIALFAIIGLLEAILVPWGISEEERT